MVSRCWSACEPLGSSLNFLEIFIVQIKIFDQIWKFFSHYFLKYSFCSFPCLLYFWNSCYPYFVILMFSVIFFSLFLFLRLNNHSWLVSKFMNSLQPLDYHLSASWSAPVSCMISTCKPLKQRLPAASSVPVSRLMSAYQPLDLHLSVAWWAHISRLISAC